MNRKWMWLWLGYLIAPWAIWRVYLSIWGRQNADVPLGALPSWETMVQVDPMTQILSGLSLVFIVEGFVLFRVLRKKSQVAYLVLLNSLATCGLMGVILSFIKDNPNLALPMIILSGIAVACCYPRESLVNRL